MEYGHINGTVSTYGYTVQTTLGTQQISNGQYVNR